MARILIVNPNCNTDCSDGIAAAVAPFRLAGGPEFEVVTLREGPPAIYSWRDWYSVVAPLCDLVRREAADVYVIACASDPGIEAVRAATGRPVLGVFRCAVAAAMARGESFGVIALVDASIVRHRAALRAMGVERLDLILLSHPDADHVGGTGAILEAYPEAQLGISAVFKSHPKVLADLVKWRLKSESVRWFPSQSSLRIGRTQIRVRCPDLFPGAIDNDGSMCLKLQHEAATAVFTGDAPVSVEERLVTEEDWSAEILKAGHHGSRTATSDTWVKAVHPLWAVLSCGRDNPYGHPHRDVVSRLERAGVTILRTDLNGDIKFSIGTKMR